MVAAKNWNKKRHILRNLVYIIVFVLSINTIQNWLLIRWENNEAKIHLSLDNVITGLQEAGYSIESIKNINDQDEGYLGKIKQGVIFNVKTENGVQEVWVIKKDSWAEARKSVENSYRIGQESVFGYTYSCGDILINVMDKKFGTELYETIRKMDNGQGEVVGCVRNPPSIYPLFYFGY